MRLFFSLLLTLVLCIPAYAQTLVLGNGVIHTASENAFQGYVVIEGDTIVKVGRGQAPAGAVDLGGLHLYPSVIDPDSSLGLVEIDALHQTRDFSEVGEVNPNLQARLAFRPDSELLPVARSGGILVAGVNPQGGLISGQGAVMRLWGWTWEDMTVVPSWGILLNWPNTLESLPPQYRSVKKPKTTHEARLGWSLFTLSEAFKEARQVSSERKDVKWSALEPFARGQGSVVVRARGAAEVQAALDWAKAEGLKLTIIGDWELHRKAEALAQAKVPVIYTGTVASLPRPREPYDLYYQAPALLRKAGVQLAFSGRGNSWDVRDQRDLAGRAVAYGLSPLEALQAITLVPARILGVEKRFGSIAPGKEATLILCDGDLLALETRVVRAWGRGKELSLDDKQKRLYEKYRNRPKSRK